MGTSTVRASKGSGSTFTAGSTVEVRTDKRVYAVIGASAYSEYAADREYSI